MFKTVTQSAANRMDCNGGLIPVHSLMDHEHFRPLCILKRKRKAIFNLFPRYRQTHYTLKNLLLPGEDNESTESLFPDGDDHGSKQFTIKKTTSNTVHGSLSLPVDLVTQEVSGGVSLCNGLSIKMEKKCIEIPKLDALARKRKMDMNLSFIQQLKKQEDLYVVYETLEALEETTYEESTKAEGSIATLLYAKFHAKGTRENKESITIPKGCTLAFKAIPLFITEGRWGLNYVLRAATEVLSFGGFSKGRLGEVEEEVKENCQVFSNLSPDLAVIFLNAIKAVMRDRNLFQELTDKMEEVLDETGSCELKTDSPDLKDLLKSLQDSSRDHCLKLAKAITYALDALEELTEDQLLLLLESLEEKIVSQQLKLVKSILEHDIERGKGPFHVDASLLSFSGEKEQKLTTAMVELSGVKLQEDGFAVCRKEAFSAVAALYVSLYLLNLLSKSD
ncbi:PREDICTED: gasdermin-A-like [Tauraco erythrolophus]|uniref:gasdermin-A-like n=1 Tax=Tauraco erythrolophus TaxID=121530 RepID=UPI000523272B|nr:PREDICTED: gasdermin-A-like [Tauraco erythrolophus]